MIDLGKYLAAFNWKPNYGAITLHTLAAAEQELTARPSKCPKFYTNRILGEQNSRQKVRKFGQNLNRNKLTYLIQ